MTETAPMPMCPIAQTCKGMMERPFSRFTLIIPAVVFMALGIVIVLEPRILAWLIAIAFILVGIMFLIMASLIRKVGMQFRNVQERGP